jgi:hypothetical protein
MARIPRIHVLLGVEKPSVDYLRDAMGGWDGNLRDTRSVFTVVA